MNGLSTNALAVTGMGMATGVGMNGPASCAAIRAAIDNFQETRFMDNMGEWLMGSEVPFAQPWRGRTRLLKMAASAIRECLDNDEGIVPASTPLLLCMPELPRPGRLVTDDDAFFRELEHELGLSFHPQSRVISSGHVSVAVALQQARQLFRELHVEHVLIAATDSLLVAPTLSHYEKKERLLTSTNSDGFIPGEAGAALVVEPFRPRQIGQLLCRGLGFAVERAVIDSEEPLRGDGLTEAITQALHDAGCGESILQFKIIDASGGQYAFKEATLAFGRLDRTKRTEFDVWHPADCIGEVGAVIGLVMIAVLKSACEKGYSKGSEVLVHVGNDDGRRSSMIFSWQAKGG